MKSALSSGSALILTVVLTGMLAIVGVLFVMMARVDKVATSAISENRELDLAIETVVARVSQELVSDIPGIAGQEYYDYPLHRVNAGMDGILGTQDDLVIDVGPDLILGTIDDIPLYQTESDPWLADLTPKFVDCCETPLNYNDDIAVGFSHITDLYGRLAYLFQLGVNDSENDRIGFRNMRARIIAPALPIQTEGDKADADGDGVADSRWVIIPDVTSSKGESIYVAVRVVDNEAMFNANTAWKFEFGLNFADSNLIDGSSQLQINLAALSQRGANGPLAVAADTLQILRCGSGREPVDLSLYQQNVIWRYQRPNGAYTPFDIGDELKLRNRFILLNENPVYSRIGGLWSKAYNWGLDVPRNNLYHDITNYSDWFWRVNNASPDPDHYDYRHITTTYNLDRVIDPRGGQMIDINDVDTLFGIPHQRYSQIFPSYFLDMNTPVGILYDRLLSSIGPVIPDPNIVTEYAQLAANIVDFCDDDDINNDGLLDSSCVTTLVDPYGNVHYGFEAQPFITEIGIVLPGTGPIDDRSKPPVQYSPEKSFFAVELYNPFNRDIPLIDFKLELFNRRTSDRRTIYFNSGDVIYSKRCFVISNNPSAFGLPLGPNVIMRPELILFIEPDKSEPPVASNFSDYTYDIFLKRDTNPNIYVDKQEVYPFDTQSVGPVVLYFGRCVTDWHVVYQTPIPGAGTLGFVNNIPPTLFPEHNFSFFLPNPLDPNDPNAGFITVGDIPRILTLGHDPDPNQPNNTIGEQLGTKIRSEEHLVRLDLQNPFHRNIFQYLTVFDPVRDFIDNDGDGLGIDGNGDGFLDSSETDLDEVKIPGRININTAPWYVLAQLPWVTHPFTADPNINIAKAIVAYRDKAPLLDNTGSLIADYTNRTNATGSPVPLREDLGFASIGELIFVNAPVPDYSIWQYQLDSSDLGTEDPCHPGFPDLTTYGPGRGDGILNDFEERDVIFSRISNLVTVRSDVFTAYILVRIGADGPQKRVIAILDRSNVGSPQGKVKIVALHYVPDPR